MNEMETLKGKVSRSTVAKLLADAGRVCAEYQDKALRSLPCVRVQCDEI